MVSLTDPHIVPDVPEETVLERAMNLIGALGAPDETKQLLSDLEVAATVNRELVETATDLKSEIDDRETELSEHETDLCEREDVVKTQTKLSLGLTTAANDLKTDLEHREIALAKRQDDFRDKQERAISYIDGVIENLRAVKQGFCNV